jgi:hypothetical protein
MEGPQGKFVYLAAPSDKPEMKGATGGHGAACAGRRVGGLPGGKGWVIRED